MTAKTESVLTSGSTSRFNIPVSHLDFDYIKKCTDTKELEKIYITLKSGDEGYFPELQQTCEDRLTELNPNSRILRRENPVSTKGDLDHDERQELDKDLKDWSSGMKHVEESMKSSQNAPDTSEDGLPPVRSGAITLTSQGAKTTQPAAKKSAMPREYRDWDKVDIDKELEKVDEDGKPKGRCFVDGKEVKDIPEYVDTKGLTESEKLMKANREKDKGNEAFKSGDYKEAIVYYSRSISLQPTAASYNNRALAYLKTEDWVKALTDTDRVLKLEPDNIKALLRQATARKGLKQFEKAKKDLDKVLEKEPNNKRAQDLLQEVEKERKEKKTKGRRLVIEDVEGEEASVTPTEESKKGSSLIKESKGSDSNSVPKGNNSVKSGRKIKIEEENEGEMIVNGHAEPLELKEKNKQETPVKSQVGHADGDTDKNKDIWTEKDVNEQIPVKTGENGDTVVKNNANTCIKSASTVGQPGDHNSDKNRTKEPGVKEDVEVNKNDAKTENVVEQEQTNKGAEQNETVKSDRENEDTETSDKSDDSTDSGDDTGTAKTLTRPVFYQKPFPANCVKLREEGNTLFKNGQYGDAISRYSKIIGILENVEDQIVNLSLMYSNRAACQLKTGDLPEAVRDCTRSLQLIPHSVKPLLRRAMAYEHLERPRLAYIDYRHVLLLDGRMDQAHLGTKRCQELLHQKDGPRWREKFQLPSVAWWEIPEIMDLEGKSTSQVQFNNPVPTAQQTGSTSQTGSAEQKNDSVREEKPKELSAAEKFEKFKAEGNEFVKKGQYSEAVTCYNQCMEAMPDQVAIFTNRALCYIKLHQPFEAEEDCTQALSLEKDNVKALFRRAQARKMLGKNREGIEDLNQLLKVDPKNTAAKKEMEELKKLWREELDKLKKDMPVSLKEERDQRTKSKEKTETKQRKRMVIEEVDSDEETTGDAKKDSPSKSKHKTASPKIEEISSSRQNKSQHKPTDSKSAKQSEKDSDRKTGTSQPGSKDSKKSKKKSQIKDTSTGLPNVQPSVPKLEKATPYEFISAWNALKKSKSLQPYYDLLQQIPVKDLSSVISNKLDGPMLNVMIRCAADYYLPKGEMDGAYQLLKNLSTVQRFGTVSMFMSSEEQSGMKSILEKLASHTSSIYSKEDILKLQKCYSIK